EVGERHRALADADHLGEARPARLVTQVRAVRQVVRAILAREELIEEGSLVAGAAGRVEHGLVGRAERGERRAGGLEGAAPRDRPGVVAARAQPHRLDQPALRVEPAVGLAAQLRGRPGEEELAPDARAGRLVRDGLGPALAELDRAVLRALRPRAAL